MFIAEIRVDPGVLVEPWDVGEHQDTAHKTRTAASLTYEYQLQFVKGYMLDLQIVPGYLFQLCVRHGAHIVLGRPLHVQHLVSRQKDGGVPLCCEQCNRLTPRALL